MTINDLAKRAKLDRKIVYSIVNNQAKPYSKTVKKLAEALGVTPAEFYS